MVIAAQDSPSGVRQLEVIKTNSDSSPTTKFTLRLDYACRENMNFNSCQGKVFWNGKLQGYLRPKQ